MRFKKLLVIWVLIAITLGACTIASTESSITILAGSELKDIEPFFDQIRRETGLQLEMQYIGSLEGAELLLAGEQVDMAWFSHAKYLSLLQGDSGLILAQEKIMLSPVVLGVKRSLASQWDWIDNPNLTWQDIVDKAGSGQLRYAMTNPASSNTGFTALVGAAAALSGSSDALEIADIEIVRDDLIEFFKGQALTAGSSGWLADRYLIEQEQLDGMINYESVLLGLNQSGNLDEELYLVYPSEGIVTADYPLMLINSEKREQYTRLVEYLRSPEFQTLLMEKTLRRPATTLVSLSNAFPSDLLVELPFPNNQEVIDQLIFTYLDEASVPPHSFFVLDVSGSMEGERIQNLKNAIGNLTGGDQSLTGRFARFRDREKITLIVFSGEIEAIREFEVNLSDPDSLQEIVNYVNSLEAGGKTAIFSTLAETYSRAIQLQATEPDRYYSIVLMSDGENTTGMRISQFREFYNSLPQGHNIKTFTILFGDADEQEMQEIAELTGGRVFDAKSEALSIIFKQIRGYQ